MRARRNWRKSCDLPAGHIAQELVEAGADRFDHSAERPSDTWYDTVNKPDRKSGSSNVFNALN